jgi:hypothetical protein
MVLASGRTFSAASRYMSRVAASGALAKVDHGLRPVRETDRHETAAAEVPAARRGRRWC